MNKINAILEGYKKGTYLNLETVRFGKTKKSCTSKIVKRTLFKNARLGMNYDNLQQTQDFREQGSIPEKNAGLPWGEWEMYPFIITHKGNRYLRAYVKKDLIVTEWYKDGERVSKEEIEDVLLASEKRSSSTEEEYFTLTLKEETLVV